MKTENETKKQIGSRIKDYRQKHGLKQSDLAKKAGISSNYYSKIERGEINTTIEKLQKIVNALGVKSSDILPF